MKRKLIAGFLVATMIAGIFAFAGCDTIAPSGGDNSADNNQGSGNQGGGSDNNQGSGNQGGGSDNNQGGGNESVVWFKDDDYHWHDETDKALHTVEDGLCTECGKEVSHTVGLEYELVTPASNAAARFAIPLVDLENNGSYYVVTGLGSATDSETVIIPSEYNGIPVKEIGENAFYNTSSTAMRKLLIPNSITHMEKSAFYGTKLSHVLYEGDMASWDNLRGDINFFIDTNLVEPFASIAVYFYAENASETGRYWHYSSTGNIEVYTNFAGLAGRDYYAVHSELGSHYFWQLQDITFECEITSADGDNFTYDVYAITSYWIGDTRHDDRQKLDLTEEGDAQLSFNAVLYEVPDGYNGNDYPGSGWQPVDFTTMGIRIGTVEAEMVDGRFSILFWWRLELIGVRNDYSDAYLQSMANYSVNIWVY